MTKKIGVGLVTYNRPEYFKQSIEALKDCQYPVIIVNDGSDEKYKEEYNNVQNKYSFVYIEHEFNKGVAAAKNTALKTLLDIGCEYLFLIEDDIIIKDLSVFQEYVDYMQMSGYHHFNFAHHGTMNKEKIDDLYMEGVKIGELYPNCVGAFSCYTSVCLADVGLMDENFKNAWEHVEHTNRLAKKGYTTPFWYFIDIPNSKDFLTEIEGSIDNSSIRPQSNWSENIKKGLEYWKQKDGIGLPIRP